MDAFEQAFLRHGSRYLAHMRAEMEDKRFGLVLGAGVSRPLGFPSWTELVERVAAHPKVEGNHVISGAGVSLPDTSKTQMLFQHYRSKALDLGGEPPSAKLERRIQGDWRRIIHECLYRNVPPTAAELRETHPYLKHFVNVIATSAMTINYNFDDTIQQLLLLDRPNPGSNAMRSFETVWSAYLPFRPDTAIIHHPNGFLPRNLLEYPSENLVFSEDSFADQLIESMAGHHASLLHHFSKSTCLFLGLSLQDPTLRHLLRQSAVINPGHYHYYVHYRERGSARDAEAERALREANFEVYNLVTLFLDDDEIAALGRLLAMPEADLRREAEELGAELNYFYYLTGAVGAGKTTCLSYFGSFKTYEEWAEVRPPELGKAWTDLSDDERTKLDAWIIRQFDLKNCKLLDQRIGLHVIDRTPLDPIAFTEAADAKAKAHAIVQGLSPGRASRKPRHGHVVLLTGDPDDMEARVIGRHKQSRSAVIADMQMKLKTLFDGVAPSVVNTFGLSIAEVIKQVSRVILLEEYRTADLTKLLSDVEDGVKIC